MAEKASEAWLPTYGGGRFYPLAPRVEDIHLEDIAHALAHTCRWRGHVRWYYSVAQHSVLASHLCGESPAWALLHDAAEAYLVDLCHDLKPHMRGFAEAEDRILRAVAKRFGMAWPMPAPVRVVDRRLAMTEARDLLAKPMALDGAEYRGLTPYAKRIMPWSPEIAKAMFLETARKVAIAK